MGFNEIPRGGEYTPDGFTRATHADKTRYLIENGRDKFAFGASLLEPTYRLSLPVESLPKINDGRVLQHEAMVCIV